ncbi:hypothetical protein AQUSIP_23690 [Aquicella siphonis]|uniref:DUF4442 domain-containing protein n=1 Tax=Aquicella siphonis TaxID=254247 RepID=A0A5E4PL98_9COXI|nr:DUF4442 domain-containing protein [Aquicella siphonis]VVC77042.1 hypothetical protein AQUSIP_23690 [Aquicella siphonis]
MSATYAYRWTQKIPVCLLRWMINFWPPYLGTGIWIEKITDDFRTITVRMSLRWYNRNYVGTHFGGSMYAMTDPFYMLMLIKNLGENYIVWDKAAYIEFKKPGKDTLRATFAFTREEIQAIRHQADMNEKFVFDRPVDLFDQEGRIVARVVKTLYVRKK